MLHLGDWDGGQNCLPECLNYMNKKKSEKGCCEAKKLSEGKTICNFCDTAEIVKPGVTSSKAVMCKGTFNCFQYRMLIIRL